ncbi:hypothetical protein LCGC14_1698470 [marine sediment metagenome]|uniref:Uncharacterized protein n=1 Tax=marine sediment metagenome TaxID=412755 RepID=A0A0F9HJ92_9ZZZZ
MAGLMTQAPLIPSNIYGPRGPSRFCGCGQNQKFRVSLARFLHRFFRLLSVSLCFIVLVVDNSTAEPKAHVEGVPFRPLTRREAQLFRQAVQDWRLASHRYDVTISLGPHIFTDNTLWVQGGLN